MKKILLFFILVTSFVRAQHVSDNEYLKYRVHYGFLNAGFATIQAEEAMIDGRPQLHIVGKGSSSGAVRVFYKVDDRYETYIDKATHLPTRFIRKIDEGGYTRDQEMFFNHANNTILEKDYKNNTATTYRVKAPDVQDMLSAFYYLRKFNNSDFTTGSSKTVYIFMSGELFPFKLKVLGRETIDTKFGEIKCIKMRPYVQKGRVFKEKESVTLWVSDDENLVPIQLEAELAVGSLQMSIHDYKNVKSKLDFK